MPRPQSAGGGGASTGFSRLRDDRVDIVHAHRGVVTKENTDGTSKLSARDFRVN
jgi:hypothetical protein